MFDCSELFTWKGPREFEFDGPRLKATLIAEQASVFVKWDINSTLVWSGSGQCDLDLLVGQPFVLDVVSSASKAVSMMHAGSRETRVMPSPSFTDLECIGRNVISAEMQAVIDRMNRNAIIREQAMLRSLGNRR